MSILIRFRTRDGMLRIPTNEDSKFKVVLDDLVNKISCKDLDEIYIGIAPNTKGEVASSICDRTVKDLGLKNGELLFVNYQAIPAAAPTPLKSSINKSTIQIATGLVPPHINKSIGPLSVKQLPVDDLLDGQDGLIKRPQSQLCRHGDKGMCEYCSLLPPWDKKYREEKGFKHMSYHAHLNELNEQNKNSSSSYISPLEEPDYNIDLKCSNGHSPYPRGICSKCQPPVITLQQQQFRMVDHVEFSDSAILNTFIESWRLSGVQRFGILYGSYEPFDKVPLGIKAVVEAIYEPPQHGESDGLTLLPWDNEQQVDQVAQLLGLYKVGITFTDLTDAGIGNGKVLCKRHKDSYFLSCLEVLMASRYQLAHPNVSKHSKTGFFSSKFVTCVISGGLQGDIEPRSYQVSTSAEALVKADIITASTQPNQLYINKSDEKRYVPDVFYSKVNEYGLEVKTNAKPAFPVEFLLVTLLDSFPLEPNPMFESKFPIENREFLGQLQELSTVSKVISSTSENEGRLLVDFHFLTFLLKINVLGPSEFKLLLKFVKERDIQDLHVLQQSSGWMTLLTILLVT
ncbi:nuclear protein localization protein 4 [Scheffersomyces spartinae]|uniref:Nuclear protein localization protein 4 n=1 Tax=Scheffersomyces spartinae TaxID=45513 RepID=A0A9P7VAM7_9ASCO|nr:nuclear protein localization protein 4 [Scheffersomyces spartinae]KAG7194347.1 nuclear protein localization protein 4 [Scheffersomyces spartinae]